MSKYIYEPKNRKPFVREVPDMEKPEFGKGYDAFDRALNYKIATQKYEEALSACHPDPIPVEGDIPSWWKPGEVVRVELVYQIMHDDLWEDANSDDYFFVLSEAGTDCARLIARPVPDDDSAENRMPDEYGSPEFAAETYAMSKFNHHHECEKHMIAYNSYLAALKSIRHYISERDQRILQSAKDNRRYESGVDKVGFIYISQLEEILQDKHLQSPPPVQEDVEQELVPRSNYANLEKQLVELMNVTGCMNVIEVIEYVKRL